MYYDLCNGSVTANLAAHHACREVDMIQLVGLNGTMLVNGTMMVNGTDAEEWGMETTVKIVVPLFFGIIGLAGLLGNALVIVVVMANKQMRSTTNLLIINLAASDIMFVIFCVPFTATDYVLPTWPFGDLWCKVVQYLIVVTCHASVYTLVLMSFDRYLAVVHPVESMSYRTERYATIAIVSTWTVITTTAIPVAVSHGVLIYPYEGVLYSTCMFLSSLGYNLRWFQVGFFMSSYVIPLTLICLLYMAMLARLWRGNPGCDTIVETRKGRKRVTRMVYIVVLAFAVCWLPIQVILVMKSFDLYANTPLTVTIQIISHTLAYMNSCINPLLYAFLSENFRKAFRKVVRFGRPPMYSMELRGPARGTGAKNAAAHKAHNAGDGANGDRADAATADTAVAAAATADEDDEEAAAAGVALNVGENSTRTDIL